MEKLDLSDYIYVQDIVIPRYLPAGYHYIPVTNLPGIFVQKGDIIVMDQSELTGIVATLNESSDSISIHPSITKALIDEPFVFNTSMPNTKHKLAVRFLLSIQRTRQVTYIYSKPGEYEVKGSMVGNNATNRELEVKVKAIERINNVNVTIPVSNSLGRPTVVEVQSFGAPWKGVIHFDSEKTLDFTDDQPVPSYTLLNRQVYNVTVLLKNEVGTWSGYFQIETVRPVIIQEVNYCWKGIVHDTTVLIEALFSSGDNMNVSMTLDGSIIKEQQGIMTEFPKPYSLNRNVSFPTLGAFNLTVFGANALSNATVACLVFVEIPIKGFNFTGIKPTVMRTDYALTFTFGFQEGSNATYSLELNGNKNITFNCSNTQCSDAFVTFLNRTLEAGDHTLEVCVHNKVTPKSCVSHEFEAVDPITHMRSSRCKPKCINAVEDSFKVFLSIKKGTRVSCDWWIEDYGLQRIAIKPGIIHIRTLKCKNAAVSQIIANCTNSLGSVVQYSNLTCMYAVKDLVLTSDSPQVVKNGIINFTLSMPPSNQPPTNATCLMEFGDEKTYFIEKCVLPMNFSHK